MNQTLLPRLPRVLLQRPRLEKYLDEWAPLTLIQGLEGYGKTTLVAAWLERQPPGEVSTIFVTARAGDSAVAELLGGIDRGLTRLGLGRFGRPAPGSGTGPNAGATAVDRLRGIVAAVPAGRRLLLVIDDAQHVTDPALLSELLGLVRRHRGFHLIVSSRGRHPIGSLAAGRVDRRVVPAEELLCRPDEIDELAGLFGIALTGPVRGRLYSAFAGWMAPTRLTLEAVRTGDIAAFDLAPAEAYLRDTVLPGLGDRATLRRAMQLSLADRLDSTMIGELAGDGPDDGGLDLMEASGLLVRYFDGERSTFRFPQVIRDVLRVAYRAEDPAELQAFHRRLATWFDGHNLRGDDMLHAFRHALAGHDWPLADRIWRQRGSSLTMDYAQQCHEALLGVPGDVLAARPGWQVAVGALEAVRSGRDSDADGRMATLLGYINASRVVAERLDALSLNDLLFIGTWRFIGLRATSYRQSAAYAATMHTLVDNRLRAGEDPGDRLPWFWLQRGLTHQVLGDDAAARSHYLQAWQHRTPDTAAYVGANVAANLALGYAVLGETEQARLWLTRRATFDTTGNWGHHLVDVGARAASGLLALDRLDRASAAAEVERLGDGSAPLALWPFIAYLHAQFALHFGDPEAGLAALDDAVASRDDSHQGGSGSHPLIGLARADLLAASGHAQAAAQVLRTQGHDGAPSQTALARAQLLVGDYPAARAVLAGRPRIAGPRERLDFQLVDGVAALRLGDRETAGRRIAQALDSYHRTGILRAFATIPAEDLQDLLSIAGQGLADDDRQRLASARTVYPPGQPSTTLTRRERTLVQALREGRTRQETAAELHLSVNTVKSQYADLYRKLRVNSRGEALMRLEQLGL